MASWFTLPDGPEDRAIATAIVAMGHSLHMHVVAEKVETVEQAECLRGMGCDEMQGYLLSRPLQPAQLRHWLRERRVSGNVAREAAPMTRFDLHTLDIDVETMPSTDI